MYKPCNLFTALIQVMNLKLANFGMVNFKKIGKIKQTFKRFFFSDYFFHMILHMYVYNFFIECHATGTD
jgi:hypothetical protein